MNTPIAIGAALNYAQNLLGGPLTELDSNPAVGATAAIAAEGNGDRVGLVIINTGTNDAMIHFDPALSATNGIRLGASGGSVSMDVTRDFTLCTRRWYSIQIGGASTLSVIELVRVSLTQPRDTQ